MVLTTLAPTALGAAGGASTSDEDEALGIASTATMLRISRPVRDEAGHLSGSLAMTYFSYDP